MQRELVRAKPTKDFFISMITRDIGLEDSILDLLDNCVDGARTVLNSRRPDDAVGSRFSGFQASIILAGDRFEIADNCGGISIDQATNYAFHFGRRRDAPEGAPQSVGLYGIGMKRAMFKMGRAITVESSTAAEAFSMKIDVDAWAGTDDEWDFELERSPASAPGTRVRIEGLLPGVGEAFSDEVFVDRLRTIIGRDYSILLSSGFKIEINGLDVGAFRFGWLSSEEISPFSSSYDDEGVRVEIVAGMSRVPQDEDSPGETELSETQYYGWFVTCNDRVVIAGDKTSVTVWGDDRFPAWHPQYNGFTGTVHFRAEDPSLLPWTTTKRGVDTTAPLYRRAVEKMKAATRPFIDYTHDRKVALEEARAKELAATITFTPFVSDVIRLPVFTGSLVPRARVANISYQVPHVDYLKVAEALGDERMPRREVGVRTFRFFQERMVDGE